MAKLVVLPTSNGRFYIRPEQLFRVRVRRSDGQWNVEFCTQHKMEVVLNVPQTRFGQRHVQPLLDVIDKCFDSHDGLDRIDLDLEKLCEQLIMEVV